MTKSERILNFEFILLLVLLPHLEYFLILFLTGI